MTEPQDVNIPALGYELSAHRYDSNSERELLYLPGFTSNKKKHIDIAGNLSFSANRNITVIEYSGHGDSPFKLEDVTPAQNFLEVTEAYDWVKNSFPNRIIDVIGTSYGGYFAAMLSQYRDISKLILRAPASYDTRNFYTRWGEMNSPEDQQARHIFRNSKDIFIENPEIQAGRYFEGEAFVLTHEFDEACPEVLTSAYIDFFDAQTWQAEGFKHSLGETNPSDEQMSRYIGTIVDWLNK